MDYDFIVSRLAQGSFPSDFKSAFRKFDVVVYCARELQPLLPSPPEWKSIIYFPMDDDFSNGVSQEQHYQMKKLVRRLHQLYYLKRKILITCAAGRNRSGLIMTLLLLRLGYGPAENAIRIVKSRRNAPSGPAMSNPKFNEYLLALKRKVA